MSRFKLSDDFVGKYSDVKPNFGFNGLGEMVYLRTYSRVKKDGTKEKWYETVRRVVEWTFETQRQHVDRYNLGWDNKKAQRSAQEMFDRVFNFKFIPSGRSLWVAGTEALYNKPIAAALSNCSFISTENIDKTFSYPFRFLMDMSMLGVGVGFDHKGANKLEIQAPENPSTEFVIPDSREGWVEAVGMTIDAFIKPNCDLVSFDYSLIRKEGEPINGFGGTASGPEPLKHLIESIIDQFSHRAGELVSITDIVDIMNKIGCCVIAGNVRRTAEIAIGDPMSDEFLKLKDYRWNSEKGCYEGNNSKRADYGWTSNNSIFAELGMDYTKVADQIAENGEPGIEWLENMQAYSRMDGIPDNKDARAVGVNPCSEQTLESSELCTLTEIFPTRCDSIEDCLRTLKFAYMFAKTVTLCNTHNPETNRIMLRNRRIGTSMSGIAQIYDSKGIKYLKELCERGYEEIQRLDKVYSEWLCIPQSIKTTSVKPSGTVSLLAGCTPGIHFPENTNYIRRMRLAMNSDMIGPLIDAGYKVEPAMEDPSGTAVVEVPVQVTGVRKLDDVSMWEQLELAAFMQRYWADNQVSATVTFKPKEEGYQIARALDMFQYRLKGISFLPKFEAGGVFHQMPYESITEEEYLELNSKLKPIKWKDTGDDAAGEKFCNNSTCEIN